MADISIVEKPAVLKATLWKIACSHVTSLNIHNLIRSAPTTIKVGVTIKIALVVSERFFHFLL